jgi:DnaK suppressor protein
VNNQVIDSDNAGLRPEDLAGLRENLHEQRLFRKEQLQQIAAPSQTRAERMRGRRAASQIEVPVKLAASARVVLSDVEAALEQIDQGRYGRCHLCAQPTDLVQVWIGSAPAASAGLVPPPWGIGVYWPSQRSGPVDLVVDPLGGHAAPQQVATHRPHERQRPHR